jgi:hypothetical protein
MLIPSKDEVAANVDLARRRSRVAAFVALKSVCLGAICGISWSLRRPIFGFASGSLRSAVGFTVENGLIRVDMSLFLCR